MPTAKTVQNDLKRHANAAKGKTMSGFFKTGKGQYGAGDVFIGVSVPDQRVIAKKHGDLSLREVDRLLKSKTHEHRLTAWIILTLQFNRGNVLAQKKIYEFLLRRTQYMNNWDMVDTAAPAIVGAYLLDQPRSILVKLAKSINLWERRIAIVATQTLIRYGQFNDTLKIAAMLLNDKHDLIHKAVGWMLREVGDQNRATEEKFLQKYVSQMPRTMLRYAIEKFPDPVRRRFLAM